MEPEKITFGTDGWRAIIADDYTFDNVRACAQGVAAYHIAQGLQSDPIIVGYDTRFGSADFADAVVEVLAGNGLNVLRCTVPAPTPAVGYNLVTRGAAGGIMITASHNPAKWNGFKYRTSSGGSAPPEVLVEVEKAIHQLKSLTDINRMNIDDARSAGLVTDIDPAPTYLAHIATLVDLDTLRSAGCKVVVDPMHGAGAGYFAGLLSGGATKVLEIRGTVNPSFPDMHNPEPTEHNLAPLRDAVLQTNALVGVAMDGDADRVGAIDATGKYLTSLQVYALLAYYFLEVRGLRGPIIKSLTLSNMVWRLGERYDVPVYETGVGFKFIAPVMIEKNALMGGEESGGYAFQGHIPERDGVLSALYLLDLVARKGKTLSEIMEEIYALVGPHHYGRSDVVFDASLRPDVEARLREPYPTQIAGIAIVGVDTIDGIRYRLEGGQWSVIRFSGTEPLLRIYAEAPTPEQVQELLAATRLLTGV
jgi:phosphomannomutase